MAKHRSYSSESSESESVTTQSTEETPMTPAQSAGRRPPEEAEAAQLTWEHKQGKNVPEIKEGEVGPPGPKPLTWEEKAKKLEDDRLKGMTEEQREAEKKRQDNLSPEDKEFEEARQKKGILAMKRAKDRNGAELKVGDTVVMRFTVKDISDDAKQLNVEGPKSTMSPESKSDVQELEAALVERLV